MGLFDWVVVIIVIVGLYAGWRCLYRIVGTIIGWFEGAPRAKRQTSPRESSRPNVSVAVSSDVYEAIGQFGQLCSYCVRSLGSDWRMSPMAVAHIMISNEGNQTCSTLTCWMDLDTSLTWSLKDVTLPNGACYDDGSEVLRYSSDCMSRCHPDADRAANAFRSKCPYVVVDNVNTHTNCVFVKFKFK